MLLFETETRHRWCIGIVFSFLRARAAAARASSQMIVGNGVAWREIRGKKKPLLCLPCLCVWTRKQSCEFVVRAHFSYEIVRTTFR